MILTLWILGRILDKTAYIFVSNCLISLLNVLIFSFKLQSSDDKIFGISEWY